MRFIEVIKHLQNGIFSYFVILVQHNGHVSPQSYQTFTKWNFFHFVILVQHNGHVSPQSYQTFTKWHFFHFVILVQHNGHVSPQSYQTFTKWNFFPFCNFGSTQRACLTSKLSNIYKMAFFPIL